MARPLLPPSVRARATLAATLVVAMALTGTAIVLLAVLRGNLLTSARTTALVRATDIANQASTGQLPPTVVLGGDENGFVQVVDSTGRVLASSANVRGKGTRRRAAALQHPNDNHHPRESAERADGTICRGRHSGQDERGASCGLRRQFS